MKRILLLAAVFFAAIQLSAAPVDLASAQAKAQRFVQQKMYDGKLRAPLAGDAKLVHAEMNSTLVDRAAYYIFNTPNGYVVVAGDDRAEEILGYGDYPMDFNNIPCNMKMLLDMLKEQLRPWKPAHQQMFRQFVSEAEVVTLDGNGRFLISKRLQRAAGIGQDLQFIGMDDTIEIWSPQDLQKSLKSDEEFGAEFERIMSGEE
jgi:hypothetical protein